LPLLDRFDKIQSGILPLPVIVLYCNQKRSGFGITTFKFVEQMKNNNVVNAMPFSFVCD
jgi:hypothetical protein